VTLTVTDAAGQQDSSSRWIRVEDWLVVGLGDSYGSGEGSPDVPTSFMLLAAAQAALQAAEAAASQRLIEWLLTDADTDQILALVATAQARLSAWQAAVAARNDACNPLNFPPTPVLCAEAQIAASSAATQLIAALGALGLEVLFGEPTLGGALANLGASALNALSLATAALEAAEAAFEAALVAVEQAFLALEPMWQSRQCHRSAHSGQVQAARLLEEADPHTSVTFVHLACSGATIQKGLIGGYTGQEAEAELPAQLSRVGDLAAERKVDAAVVSIGGNDVNFADVIIACAKSEPCFEATAADDPEAESYVSDYCSPLGLLSPLCERWFENRYLATAGNAGELFFDEGGSQAGKGLDDLPANFDALQAELESLGDSPPRVLLTAYPSITRREGGGSGAPSEPCGFDPLAPFEERLRNLPGVTLPEIVWAEEVVAPLLAQTMQTSALAHGWTFVDGHVAAFDGHGYCAEDNWIVRIPQSFLTQGRGSAPGSTPLEALEAAALASASGSVHPNPSGHTAYASAIAEGLLCDLYPDCDVSARPGGVGVGLSGARIAVKDKVGAPKKRRLALRSTSSEITAPSEGGDPTLHGASLRVGNPGGGDDDVYSLPAAGWRARGGAFVYEDRKLAYGPCKRVELRPGRRIEAKCQGAGLGLTLDEPSQGTLAAALWFGSDPPLCMEFGGRVVRDRPASDRRVGSFEAKDAPAPSGCTLP
jgi:lysophospholipase L1-like esterase